MADLEQVQVGITRALQSIDVNLAEAAVVATSLKRSTQAYGDALRSANFHLQKWNTFFQMYNTTIMTDNHKTHDSDQSFNSTCTSEPPPAFTADQQTHPTLVTTPAPFLHCIERGSSVTPDITSPPITSLRQAPSDLLLHELSLDTPSRPIKSALDLDISLISTIDTPHTDAHSTPIAHDIFTPRSLTLPSSPSTPASFSIPYNQKRLTDLSDLVESRCASPAKHSDVPHFSTENIPPNTDIRLQSSSITLNLQKLPTIYRSGIARQQITELFNCLKSKSAPMNLSTLAVVLDQNEEVLNLLLDILQNRLFITSSMVDGVRHWMISS
uniref:Uncharacterized protein n=1 Tax=Spongospora subterranea TaxID=70186 RepID=A0A0H5R6A7_9EUKA|eukprot:CRZ09678.1 hypothetical protein [Spongospora subterranea]